MLTPTLENLTDLAELEFSQDTRVPFRPGLIPYDLCLTSAISGSPSGDSVRSSGTHSTRATSPATTSLRRRSRQSSTT